MRAKEDMEAGLRHVLPWRTSRELGGAQQNAHVMALQPWPVTLQHACAVMRDDMPDMPPQARLTFGGPSSGRTCASSCEHRLPLQIHPHPAMLRVTLRACAPQPQRVHFSSDDHRRDAFS